MTLLAALAAQNTPREELPAPVAAVAFCAILVALWWQWGTRD